LDEKNKNILPRKKLFNKDKINKIITEDTNETKISSENVYNKFNHIVNKINDKVHKEIINNPNNYFDILKDKKSQENIFNMICFSILSKIENIVNL
jgi:transcriptional regulator NrdR family protein